MKIELLAAKKLARCGEAVEELNGRIAELKNELAETDEVISVEKARLSAVAENYKLNLKVSSLLIARVKSISPSFMVGSFLTCPFTFYY